MPITQNKRRIKVQHVVGEGTAQIDVVRNIRLVENPLDPPEEQIPINARKIVDVDAEIIELDYEILPNKVIIKGALHKQIYYVEEGDYVVREFTVMREEFTDFVHIQGAKPDMDALIDAQLLYIDTNAAGDFPTDTIHQAAVLSVTVKVIEILQLDVVTDVTGPGITVEKELFKVESVVGEKEKQTTVSAEHELNDDARKIKEMDAVCRDLDYEILPGKVIVRGTLHKQVYYVDEADDTVQEQSFDNEFSVVIDIPGAEPDMDAYIKCKVEYCEANLIQANAEGVSDRVKTNCILQVFAKVTELIELNIVTNVKGAQFDRRRIRVEDIIGKECHQENVNQSIDVTAPEDVPDDLRVAKTKDLHARIRNVTYEKIRNKVIVKGTIHVQAYYIDCTSERELRETSADIPFTTFVHFEGITEDTMIDVTERVEYTDVKLEGESCQTSMVRAIAILEICVRAYELKDFIVVVDVKDTVTPKPPEDKCPPSGYYEYTVVAGDTYFIIAQKLQNKVPGLTPQDIQRANPGVDPRRLRIGQTLKIPCVVGKG
jgi:LysM repeat protein